MHARVALCGCWAWMKQKYSNGIQWCSCIITNWKISFSAVPTTKNWEGSILALCLVSLCLATIPICSAIWLTNEGKHSLVMTNGHTPISHNTETTGNQVNDTSCGMQYNILVKKSWILVLWWCDGLWAIKPSQSAWWPIPVPHHRRVCLFYKAVYVNG